MSADGADKSNANSSDIIFTIKDTKVYVSVVTVVTVVTFTAKDNQKLTKLLSKGFERSVYWNEFETKSQNKNTKNKCRYFLQSNFVEVNRLFVSVYAIEDGNAKTFKTCRYFLPKGIINNYNVIINGKSFY